MSLWLNEQHKSKEGKSLEKTKQLRELGNKEFQVKNYSASIHLYTKSLQYAPMGSEDLALAVANRSASLFYLEKFEVRIIIIALYFPVFCTTFYHKN